jgi:hypothetical protein
VRHWITLVENASFEWNENPRGLLDSEIVVWLNVEKIDASFRKDRDFYLDGPDSKNAIGDRYARFAQWLERGIAVNPPEVHISAWGSIGFSNGRHRFAWMRNNGVTEMPFVVPKEQAEEIVARFS